MDIIEANQEWVEDSESKTGWMGLGWMDKNGNPIDESEYEISHIFSRDKYYNPVGAVFVKISESIYYKQP